ncbi:MAG TPA: aldolase/citrate lyase family protein [Candidatus Dormibacteraeota bacterium]|jgi:4-hydroxy-2-oxoheptanedioate aldolase|nr:aldolase/citrate lyase family protein [Candidatus Dormibacteraeota bacterium]
MSGNRLRARWDAGEVAVGAWCSLGSPFAAELCAAEGFDYVCADLQHGLMHFDTLGPMMIAVGRTAAAPVVRVPANQRHYMGMALDAGAEAVIVPMVNSRSEAEMAVSGCRYPPEGTRSFGPVRAGMFTTGSPAAINRGVLCLVMIETIAAVEHAGEICSTPGVDGVYIGPADLAVSMGLAPQLGDMGSAHAQAIAHVRATCAANGIVAGIHTGGGEQAGDYIDAGFRMVTLSTDAALLRQVHRTELATARGRALSSAAAPSP